MIDIRFLKCFFYTIQAGYEDVDGNGLIMNGMMDKLESDDDELEVDEDGDLQEEDGHEDNLQ